MMGVIMIVYVVKTLYCLRAILEMSKAAMISKMMRARMMAVFLA